MPTYDYQCQDCGHRFEFFQQMSEKPLTGCPECGGSVRRLIGTGAGVLVKDSGGSGTEGNLTTSPRCGRDRPCCGRDSPCDTPPCDQ